MSQVDLRNLEPVFASRLYGAGDGASSAAPADDQQLTRVRTVDLERWQAARDAFDLLLAHLDHLGVVLGLVGHVARDVLLGEAADPMLEPGGPGDRPWPGQGLGIPGVGLELPDFGRRGELDRLALQRRDVRYQPGLRAIGEVAVGEHDDRRHETDGDAERLEHGVEALARRRGGEDRKRALGMTPVEGREEVSLLGLGG
jgi:hypothetical protein